MSTVGGAVKRGMRDYNLTLDGVNEQSVDTDGDFFHVQLVSVQAASILLRFDDGPQIVRTQGEGNRVYYSRVSVSASVPTNLTLQLGFGYATDSRASFGGNLQAVIQPSSICNDTAGVAVLAGVHQILPINLNRKRVSLFSDPANVANSVIYVRKHNGINRIGFVTPGQALKVEGTFDLDTDAANPGDTLYIFEEQ